MGNDSSQLQGIDLDERAIEVTDHWTLFSAVLNTPGGGTILSVFQGEPVVQGQLWLNFTPLEKASKNLMLHRHPCILKYVSSWRRDSGHYLAVESAKPLSISLSSQGGLQICLGLRNILRALIFLHDQAHSYHNNICISSIYVTNDGSWKLGGLEYMCKESELSESFLDKSRPYRYNKAIDPNESKYNGKCGDQYSFAVLVDEVLRTQSNDDIPAIDKFKEFCSTQLMHPDPAMRPTLSAVLLHPFFTHDFLVVHLFLTELPLKNKQDKQIFFNTLMDRLITFEENLVASHLSELLISRIVLLDTTAQTKLLPFVLRPRNENNTDSLFSESIFKLYLIPKLKQVFCVRDIQIREVLLNHFSYYIHMFNPNELTEHILPELLVGIKDTNDALVSSTLHCLADLVPLLGAAAVIGGHRERLFTDGRPNHDPLNKRNDIFNKTKPIKYKTKSKSLSQNNPSRFKLENCLTDRLVTIKQDDDGLGHSFVLPERPSPDGGEDVKTSSDNEDFENEEWSDWDNEENKNFGIRSEQNEGPEVCSKNITHADQKCYNINAVIVTNVNNDIINRPIQKLTDIAELDIKNQKMPKTTSISDVEIDFFQDMQPVIAKTNLFFIEEDKPKTSTDKQGDVAKKFAIENSQTEENWGEDISDWGDE